MSHKYKTHHKEEVTRYDPDTGEVSVSTRTQVFKAVAEPSFVKMYIDDISKLSNIGSTATKLLFAMVKRVGYDSVITLAPYIKKEMCKEMGIKSAQTVENALGELKKNKLITNIGRGTFMLNPEFFARGQWNEIEKLRDAFKIELKITYDSEGRRVESNLQTGVLEVEGRAFINDDMGSVELN